MTQDNLRAPKAVVLAGGKGTRLRPYTAVIPKPLVPVGEKAILEILIGQLVESGITDLTLCVNHFARLIEAYFGNGSQFGATIEYSLEDKPLSTMAPLRLIDNLPDDFLVMNGDLLTDIDFKEFLAYHKEHKALLTVATYSRKQKIDFGVIDIDASKLTATGFREKPETDLSVSMGVYALNRRILDFIPANEKFGFDGLMLALLEANEPIKVFPFEGYWLDIGRPGDYDQANKDVENES